MCMIKKFNKKIVNQFLVNNYDQLSDYDLKKNDSNKKNDVETNQNIYQTNLSNTISYEEES